MSKFSSTLFILLPAYNEEKALGELIPAIGRTMNPTGINYKICIVDDGSSDKTKALVSSFTDKFPLVYLSHQRNQGYGAALQTGFSWIMKNATPNDIALSLDADNTHLPIYIPHLIDKVESGYDVVTASYSMKGGRALGVPLKRHLASFFANVLFNLSFHVPGTHSFTNGFRAYRVRILQDAYQKYGDRLIEDTGFPGGLELFLKACRANTKTGEIPFTLHYQNRGSESKMNFLQTVCRYLQLIYRWKKAAQPTNDR